MTIVVTVEQKRDTTEHPEICELCCFNHWTCTGLCEDGDDYFVIVEDKANGIP